MAWFKREKKSIDQPVPTDERTVKTEGLWTKCAGCRTIVWKKDLEANFYVCPKCQHHFRVGSKKRLELLLDGHWVEHDAALASSDPLHFTDTRPYATRLRKAQRDLGMADAIITAEGLLNRHARHFSARQLFRPDVERQNLRRRAGREVVHREADRTVSRLLRRGGS